MLCIQPNLAKLCYGSLHSCFCSFACLLAAGAGAAALATVVDDKKECFDTTVACRAASLLSQSNLKCKQKVSTPWTCCPILWLTDRASSTNSWVFFQLQQQQQQQLMTQFEATKIQSRGGREGERERERERERPLHTQISIHTHHKSMCVLVFWLWKFSFCSIAALVILCGVNSKLRAFFQCKDMHHQQIRNLSQLLTRSEVSSLESRVRRRRRKTSRRQYNLSVRRSLHFCFGFIVQLMGNKFCKVLQVRLEIRSWYRQQLIVCVSSSSSSSSRRRRSWQQ